MIDSTAVPPGTIILDSLAKPCRKCDVCDVTVPFTPFPRLNPLPPHRSVTSFMDDPYRIYTFAETTGQTTGQRQWLAGADTVCGLSSGPSFS